MITLSCKTFSLLFLVTIAVCILQASNHTPVFAATSSNCVETCIGTCPANAQGGCESDVGDYAKKLEAAIKAECTTHATLPNASYVIVNTTTQSCVDKLPNHSELRSDTVNNVVTAIHTSVNGSASNGPGCRGNFQCVGFALSVAEGVGVPLKSANGEDFAGDRTGYKWYNRGTELMQIGDIPVWSSPVGGHIAVTVDFPAKNPNNPSQAKDLDSLFTVAEANGCDGPYSTGGGVGEETYPNEQLEQFPEVNPDLHYLGFLRKDPSIQ